MIIGAGAAGCTCAIQLKRQGLEPILFECAQVGGLARNANLIENYLGFPNGLTGEEFCQRLENHLQELDITVISENITNISWNKPQTTFLVESEQQKYTCHYLVVATGTKPRKLNKEGEEELVKKGRLFYEPKDLPQKLRENKRVIIIGSGDAAFDYALNLSTKSNYVTIVHRKKIACLPLLHERAILNDHISLKYAAAISGLALIKEDTKELVELTFDDGSKLTADYLLVAIGREPNTIIPEKQLFKKVENGHLYLAGDVVNHPFRQIAIAAGSGLKIAMKIAKKIEYNSNNTQEH